MISENTSNKPLLGRKDSSINQH